MRVLVLHSRYASGSISGENRVVEDEVRLLREAGHEVRAWTPFAGDLAGLELAATGGRAVWSRQAVSKSESSFASSRRMSSTFTTSSLCSRQPPCGLRRRRRASW